jgi:hypothetical protein
MITLIRDDEPFLMRERSGEELADSDLGLCQERPEKRTMAARALHGSAGGLRRRSKSYFAPE